MRAVNGFEIKKRGGISYAALQYYSMNKRLKLSSIKSLLLMGD